MNNLEGVLYCKGVSVTRVCYITCDGVGDDRVIITAQEISEQLCQLFTKIFRERGA